MLKSKQKNERPFAVLHSINSRFNELGQQYPGQSNAVMIRRGLLDAGFSNEDINAILEETQKSIKTA